MLTVILNGKQKEFENALSVKDLLGKMNLPNQMIAVAINLEVVPKSEFEHRIIRDKDHIDILQAIGGG